MNCHAWHRLKKEINDKEKEEYIPFVTKTSFDFAFSIFTANMSFQVDFITGMV